MIDADTKSVVAAIRGRTCDACKSHTPKRARNDEILKNLQNKLKVARAEIVKLEQELVDESMRTIY